MTAKERLINGYSLLIKEEKMTVEQVPETLLTKVYVEKIKTGEIVLVDVPEVFRTRVEELVNMPEEPTYTLDEAATILAQEVSQ